MDIQVLPVSGARQGSHPVWGPEWSQYEDHRRLRERSMSRPACLLFLLSFPGSYMLCSGRQSLLWLLSRVTGTSAKLRWKGIGHVRSSGLGHVPEPLSRWRIVAASALTGTASHFCADCAEHGRIRSGISSLRGSGGLCRVMLITAGRACWGDAAACCFSPSAPDRWLLYRRRRAKEKNSQALWRNRGEAMRQIQLSTVPDATCSSAIFSRILLMNVDRGPAALFPLALTFSCFILMRKMKFFSVSYHHTRMGRVWHLTTGLWKKILSIIQIWRIVAVIILMEGTHSLDLALILRGYWRD